MIRRKKRNSKFELNLSITDETFIAPPNEIQRRSILNSLMNEFCDSLEILDSHAREFVEGTPQIEFSQRGYAAVSEDSLVEDWQIPLLSEMAKVATEANGDVLEVGFGRGISADFIQKGKPRSHTIIECNPSIISRLEEWREKYVERDISIIRGMWQESTNELGDFDGILFHTYPLDEEEFAEYVSGSSTFAEHFFPVASAHLRKGGVFTYFSGEIGSLSRAHQESLFKHFSSIETRIVRLELPASVKDTWWSNQMVLVKAVK